MVEGISCSITMFTGPSKVPEHISNVRMRKRRTCLRICLKHKPDARTNVTVSGNQMVGRSWERLTDLPERWEDGKGEWKNLRVLLAAPNVDDFRTTMWRRSEKSKFQRRR